MEVNDKIGPYTIIRVLSKSGGFADIYEASKGGEAPAAVKILRGNADEISAGLFRNEARLLE